jgi:uncharacterized protein YqeY
LSIYERVNAELKEAMKAQDKTRLNGLRGIRAAFIEVLKLDNSTTIPDEKAFEILRRLSKQRKESIEAYTAGGRTDLATEEQRELEVLEAFLPKMADEATMREWVVQAIAAAGAATQKDLGKVMGALNGAHRGQFDGKAANTLIRELLPPA